MLVRHRGVRRLLDQAYFVLDAVCGTIQLIFLLCLAFIRIVSMIQTTLLFENAVMNPVIRGKLNKGFETSKNCTESNGYARSSDCSETDRDSDSLKASSSGEQKKV